MNILLFHTWRVLNSTGGAEKVLFNMANIFQSQGHSVTVMFFEKSKNAIPFFPVNKSVRLLNLYPKLSKVTIALNKIFSAFDLRKNKKYLRWKTRNEQKSLVSIKAINDLRPDIVICFTPDANYLIDINREKLNCRPPVITMFHHSAKTLLKICKDDVIKSLKNTDCVQVLMPYDLEDLKKFELKKSVCIGNIVPRFGTEVENKQNIICYVGRIDKGQKNTMLLLEAYKLIFKDFPDWKVEIWGEQNYDRDYFLACKNFVDSNGLSDLVLFKGTTKNVGEIYSRSKIFAMPSNCEGFSLALTEALSSGIPAVGLKKADSVNVLIVNNYNGLLSDDNPESYAACLKKLMLEEDTLQKFSENARKSVEQYSEKNIMAKWQQLIDELVSQKSSM